MSWNPIYEARRRERVRLGLPPRTYTFDDYVLAKVDRSGGAEACWPWMGEINHGYGVAYARGKGQRAHREVYRHLIGPIPTGLEIDHLCRNRACCNPAHMEPVTHAENSRRAVPFRPKTTGTKCRRGHDYSPDNTAFNKRKGHRVCLICKRLKLDRSNDRRRKVAAR